MPHFTRHIPVAPDFSPVFFFNKIHTANGIRYHVSVIDKGKRSCSFDREEKKGAWKIINAPKIPDWIMNIEK